MILVDLSDYFIVHCQLSLGYARQKLKRPIEKYRMLIQMQILHCHLILLPVARFFVTVGHYLECRMEGGGTGR